jgi:hypothetical protein
MSNPWKIYHALDLKHKALIKKLCPEVVLDGVVWYDTTGMYLEDSRAYLKARNVLVVHPMNCSLWRFQ